MLLAQLTRYGFLGIHGLFGIVLGLLICLVLLWGFWAIFSILQAKFSTPETAWVFQIIRIVITVLIAVWFIQLIFNVFG
jgi:hypothetical protein